MNSDFEDISDEEYFNIIVYSPRTRLFRERPKHFYAWNDVEFYNRFRMSKQTALIVLNQIKPKIENSTNWNHALSAETMFFVTLRFYASGGMLIASGDFCGITKSTVSKCVKKVSLAICSLRDQYIKFPQTEEQKNRNVMAFYRLAKFPRVIAALDCTHVRIQSPGGEMGEIYRNRKGFFSFNVQAFCNANLEILDVVARWPGSSHDSTIFANSRICSRFESGEFGNKVIVADGGYACQPHILTPLRNPSNPSQVKYNTAQIATRNPVERLFGVWKRRFPVLAMGLRLKVTTVQIVVVATGILHNICVMENENDLPALDDYIEEQIQLSSDVPSEATETDIGTAREVMIEYFRRLSAEST